MVNDEVNYQTLNISEDTMLSNDYEPVAVSESDQSSYDEDENNEVIQEIYGVDNTGTPDDVWQRNNAIRYLIFCRSQLRKEFAECPDKKKKSLWQLVSERMVKRGFYIDALTCEIKWRNLKKIYMYNKMRTINKDGTKGIIVWDHYYDMDKAIKGIPYEISDIDDDDNDKECAVDKCISTGEEYENTNLTTSERDIDKWQWTVDSTKELIRLYGKEKSKFSAVSQGGKHLLWEDIAQQLSNLGYQCSANSCNDKWRNLKMTYRKNKQRALKYGTEYVKWFCFKDMDSVLMNSTDDSSDHNNMITMSLIDEIDVKKENVESYEEVDSQSIQNVNIIENIENNDGEETISGSLEVWTEAATKCLIDLWGIYRPRFLMAPQGKKRLLWNDISDELRQNGHNYSGLVCDRKWRLLKANYLKRKEKYKKLGVNSVKWQYYHDLDKLLGTPTETISWNMDSTMCLIDCFDHHKEKFMRAATGEKLLIWKEISEEMLQNGYNYSSRSCDNKWRTLKNRYHKNRIRANRNKKVIWVYYDKINSVLKDVSKEMNPKHETNNSDMNNQTYDNNEMDEHNYIKTSKQDCTIQLEAITELKDLFKMRNMEFDQRFKEMEDNVNKREKVFEELQQQTLEALKRSNELEAHKLKLLTQLISRLPPQT